MENLEQVKKPEGTNEYFRMQNPDGTISAFKTKEELDKHIEDLRDSSVSK
jgi:predicted Holliday junction resolvase-like endonuclease